MPSRPPGSAETISWSRTRRRQDCTPSRAGAGAARGRADDQRADAGWVSSSRVAGGISTPGSHRSPHNSLPLHGSCTGDRFTLVSQLRCQARRGRLCGTRAAGPSDSTPHRSWCPAGADHELPPLPSGATVDDKVDPRHRQLPARRIGSGVMVRASSTLASTDLVAGRSTARCHRPGRDVDHARQLDPARQPSSKRTSTSTGVESICPTLPGAHASASPNAPAGRAASERRVQAHPVCACR